MKKGFTLIELLIVMVLVGVLVTIALPKYYVAMERGRAMEGITNLRAASDFINARYIMNENTYPDVNAEGVVKNGVLLGDFTKSVYFNAPVYSLSGTTALIQIARKDGNYDLSAQNANGELTGLICTPKGSGNDLADNKKLCENIGFELSNGKYMMDLTK